MSVGRQPPFGVKEIDENKIRIIAHATDLAVVRGQTIRVIATTADALAKRKDVIVRFIDAYRETLDYMYSPDPKVIQEYAEFAGMTPDIARRTRDFFPKELLNPDQIRGLDLMMPEAVNLKFIASPLSSEQLQELIQVPPRK
jgi:NitT/TauT family transport system substrate-binding protein